MGMLNSAVKGSQDLPDCIQRKSNAHWLLLQWEPPKGAAAHSKLTQNLVYNIYASTIWRKKKRFININLCTFWAPRIDLFLGAWCWALSRTHGKEMLREWGGHPPHHPTHSTAHHYSCTWSHDPSRLASWNFMGHSSTCPLFILYLC